jgi:hypothetical protein
MSTRQACRRTALLIGLATGASSPLAATEITVKNDSMTDASSVPPCVCFIPGDIPAAWLTSPVSGKIVGIQVFWKSALGGAPDHQETAIRIYDGSTFPTPGALLANDGGADAEVVAPLLSDGVLNEFRFLDQAQSVSMSVPVSAGQTIAVGLEIFNQSSGGGSFTPSLTYDNDGCQNGRNGVFLFDSTSWVDACPQGITGDWVIRAVIDSDVDIPAASHWGLSVFTLLLLAAGTIVALRRKPATP